MNQLIVRDPEAPPSATVSALLKRLLDRKYILQTSSLLSYPKISGTFSYTWPHDAVQRSQFLLSPTDVFETIYIIESVPRTNLLTGTFQIKGWGIGF